MQCEYLSMRGLIQLQNTLSMIRENLNPDVEIEGILPTLVDTRTVHAKEAIEILEENFGDRVFASRITKTVRFAEAPVKGMSVLKYDPDGKAAYAYRQLAKEVLGMASGKRASMREGPLAALFRKTDEEEAGAEAPRAEASRRPAGRSPRTGRRRRPPVRCRSRGPSAAPSRRSLRPRRTPSARAPRRQPAAPRSAPSAAASARAARSRSASAATRACPRPRSACASVFSSDIPENIMERAPARARPPSPSSRAAARR